MRLNPVRQTLAAGGRVLNGWCSVASSHVAELLGHQGYDSLTIDLQHGAIGYEAAFHMLQAISATPAMPMVRIPWNDPAMIMKLLDAGAYGVICPMINSRAEAEAFVGAGRYPPRGYRSFGPNRVVQYAGADYAQNADREVLLFAMIETRAGLAAIDEIATVPGLDGIYVGPGDLSLALGAPPSMAPRAPEVLDAMARIRERSRAAGVFAAVHTDGPVTAAQRFAEGFQLCTLQNDTRLLINAASAQVKAAREQMAGGAPATRRGRTE